MRGLFDGHDAPTIPGLTTLPVGSAEEVEAALARGQGKRAVTATKCNAESSRSHSILSVVVKRRIHEVEQEADQIREYIATV